jgi:O-antigen biosynthesis protein
VSDKAELQLVLGSLCRKMALSPCRDLQWDEARCRWKAHSEQAQFATESAWWLPGWYMIELVAERSVTSVAASFCFEAGGRIFKVDMPLRVGKPSKRLVYLPPGVRRLAFRPLNSEGHFCLEHFRLVWVTPWFARNRLLQRLINIHPDYRDLEQTAARARVTERAERRGESWRRTAIREYESTYVCLCSRRNYRLWTREFERLPETQRLPDPTPVYRVVMPLATDSSPAAVEDTLHSLQAQAVTSWTLTPVWPRGGAERGTAGSGEGFGGGVRDSAGEAALGSLQAALETLADSEPRLRSPVGAQAVPGHEWPDEQAASTWLALMAPGDRLAGHALAEHARAVEANPKARLLYADEDALDAEGRRHSPCFKPDWNPDLLLSSPYLGRALWVRASELGGLLPEAVWPAPAELDTWLSRLALAALSGPTGGVVHISGILYHRSTAPTPWVEAGYATLVREQLARQGVVAQVSSGQVADWARVRWPLPEPAPLVSLLVPTRDGVDILRPCVDAILERTDYRHFELLILDNQSTCTETLAYMHEVEQRDKRVRVLRWDHPFNYSAINNFGAANACGEIIGLINNDVEPMDGKWLTEMVSQACRPEIGCVGAKLYYPNGTIQHGGVVLGIGGVAGHAHRFFQHHEAGYCGRLKLVQNLSAVTAACLLLRREVFEGVGGLNEPELAVAYNDVDLCLKVLEAGYRNLWTPYAELYHHESISRGADDTPAKRARALKEARYMRRQWGPLLDRDPAYNPNLSLAHEDFSLR